MVALRTIENQKLKYIERLLLSRCRIRREKRTHALPFAACHQKTILLSDSNVIWGVQSCGEKYIP